MPTYPTNVGYPASASYPSSASYPNSASYPGNVAGFVPPVTSGLVLSLIADNNTGLDLTNVATWPDASTAGNNATQATSSKQAVLHKNSWNGHAVVRFDSVDDGYSTTCTLNNPYTLIVVCQNPSATPSRILQSATNNCVLHPFRASLNAYVAGAIANFTSTGPTVASLRVAASAKYVANGVDHTTTSTFTGNWMTVTLGAVGGSPTEPAGCDVWGAFGYNRSLTDPEEAAMEAAIRSFLNF